MFFKQKIYYLEIIIFIVFSNPVISQSRLSEQIGRYKEYKTENNAIQITATNAKILISSYAPDIIRVRAVKDEFEKDFSYAVIQKPEGRFEEINDYSDRLVLLTKDLQVIINKNPVRIKFYTRNGKSINEDDQDFGITWLGTEVTSYKKLFPDERFIGLGEKIGPLDRRGTSYINWNTDHYAYEIDADPLYTSIPFFMGIHDNLCYGIFLDNSYKSMFDFGASTDNNTTRFSASDGEMNYYFFSSPTIAEIIKNYTYLTGRMNMPPIWSLGYQQSRWSYFPDSHVLDIAKTFRDRKIPADVIYLDIDYMDAYKIFTWHPERFPRPKEMIGKLKEMGFHTAVIVDPGIKIDKGYKSYEEGIKNDYFVKYPNGKFYTGSVWPGRCHFPDFTNSNVRQWWGNNFLDLVEPGVEGFWNDMNEPAAWGQNIPDILEFNRDGDKMTLKEARNIYGMQMARATFEGTKNLLKGKRPFILTRAAFSGIQRYSALWTGDNFPSDEHMMLGVRLVNSIGLCGIPFIGPDIGGFAGDPTPELFTRWLSIGAFTPFFRNHSQINSKSKEPWTFGENIEEVCKKYISQRYRLLPYIYSSFYVSTQSGLPVARSLAINYTFDKNIYDWRYQQEYLFGDNFLIAPVDSKTKIAKVYLPEGDWYKFGNDELYSGNKEIFIESPLEDLPVFVRAGGIIPMQSLVQSTNEKPSEILNLHVYYGKNETDFVYYEDDGQSYDYEKGVYYKRIISFDPVKKEIKLNKAEGSFITIFSKINLVIHGFKDIVNVSINGKKISLKESNNILPVKEVLFDNINDEIVIKFY